MIRVSTFWRWLGLTSLLLAVVGGDLLLTSHHRQELPPAVYTFKVAYPEVRDDDVADVLDSDLDDLHFSKTQDDYETMTWVGQGATVKWIAAEDGLSNYVAVYSTDGNTCAWEAVARRLQKDMAGVQDVALKTGYVRQAHIDCDRVLDAAAAGARLAGGPGVGKLHGRGGRGRMVAL